MVTRTHIKKALKKTLKNKCNISRRTIYLNKGISYEVLLKLTHIHNKRTIEKVVQKRMWTLKGYVLT